MLVLDVRHEGLDGAELFGAEGANVGDRLVSFNFLGREGLAVGIKIILVEFFLRINILAGPLLKSLQCLLHVLRQKSNAAAIVCILNRI